MVFQIQGWKNHFPTPNTLPPGGEAIMKNHCGSTLLTLLLLISTLSLFYLKIISYMRKSFLANQLKRQSYLCLKYASTKHKKLMRDLNILNAVIQSMNLIPPNPKSSSIKKVAQYVQFWRHKAFFMAMTTNDYCSPLQKYLTLKSFPYKNNGILMSLKRSIDGTLQLKDKTWKLTVPSNLSLDVPQEMHLLKMNLSVKTKFSLSVKSGATRISKLKDSPLLKYYSSPPSWPLLFSNALN